MEPGNRYILFVLAAMGLVSCVYFLCLLAGIPFIGPIVLGAGGLFFLYRWMVPDNSPDIYLPKATTWLALSVFTIGLAVLTKNAINAAEKHGGWDAWAIWNFHSRYLQSPEHWRKMFSNVENDHPDYPLLLPSLTAFLSRATAGNFSLIIPFVVSIFTTIAAPVLIFTEFMKKNLLVAALALLLFAYNALYISCGMSQYADSLVGLFFLAAIICMEHVLENKKYIAFAMAFIGCCMWTKNEGAILAALFTLFYANRLFARHYIKLSLMGIALPLVCLIAFKLIVPTGNDLVSGLSASTWQMVADKHRYVLIWEHFFANLKEHFPYFKGIFIVYMLLCVLRKKQPDRQMLLVCTCLLVYMLIYVVSKQSLDWHLATSQNRLMAQLMPAMLYAFALKFAGKGLGKPNQFTFKVM